MVPDIPTSDINTLNFDANKDYCYYMIALSCIRAVENHDNRAQFFLGLCFDYAIGMTHNAKLAFKWYLKSAKQNYTPAQNRLGEIFKDGKGVCKDLNQAFQWYTKSAANGDAYGQYVVASF